MSTPTFLDLLRSEVARMQALHPERLGELARAQALILHGQDLPSADDPQTGQVLSSDGAKRYTVNGVCDCQAAQHGKGCKHLQSWRLYQYITKKVEAQTPPEDVLAGKKNVSFPEVHRHGDTPPAGSEAPASCNVYLTLAGHRVQVTLRDGNEQRMLARLQVLLDQYPVPQASSQATGQVGPQPPNTLAPQQTVTGFCKVHNVPMRWNEGKAGRKGWYSHRTDDGWCKGRK